MMTTSFIERYAKVFGRPSSLLLKLSGLEAFENEGRGSLVIDTNQRTLLDFGSFGIHLLGHCHPEIIHVVRQQITRMNLSTKTLANEAALLAAEKLSQLKGGDRNGVIFGNSGSEAIEITLKMCRIATGRKKFIALRHSYHGRTDGALQLSDGYYQHAAAPEQRMTCFYDADDIAGIAERLAQCDVAAVYVEPVQGEGGIRPVAPEHMQEIYKLCQDHGTRYISDEIQSGLGRSGHLLSAPWADAVVVGKTLAGGIYPISAVIFDNQKFGNAARDPIISASSYAGGALAGAVACKVLDIVSAPGFIETINQHGNLLQRLLNKTLSSHASIVAIRGAGLMIGIEFCDAHMCGEVVLEAIANNLIVSFCLSTPQVLRIYPPAVATPQEIQLAVDILSQAISTAWQLKNNE
jgi:acetylornithine aminotransferase/putrescine aminotransferase